MFEIYQTHSIYEDWQEKVLQQDTHDQNVYRRAPWSKKVLTNGQITTDESPPERNGVDVNIKVCISCFPVAMIKKKKGPYQKQLEKERLVLAHS